MVGEMSICPINWDEYYENAEKALDIIWDSNLDDQLPTGQRPVSLR